MRSRENTMSMNLVLVVFGMVSCALAQTESGNVTPKIGTLLIEDGAVTVLHLSAGYTTSVKLPEEVSSVVIGNPASFKAEHSEAEPRLVFLKPISTQTVESNALITTKSGQEISLQLISAPHTAGNAIVDFLLEYQQPHSTVIGSSGAQGFLIPESGPVSHPEPGGANVRTGRVDVVGNELEQQKTVSSPPWEGKEILVAVGASSQHERQTLLRFSVLNNSTRVVELLPPQIEFSGTAIHRKRSGRTKAEPMAVREYRMTSRRLGPGERADGVVVFERPAFKESAEKLQLQLAEAAQIDRPILMPVPFTATQNEGEQ
jgi:hypothetical protein